MLGDADEYKPAAQLFAPAAMLVEQIHRPKIPVWRVSSDQSGDPVDREANGKISLLKAIFGPLSEISA